MELRLSGAGYAERLQIGASQNRTRLPFKAGHVNWMLYRWCAIVREPGAVFTGRCAGSCSALRTIAYGGYAATGNQRSSSEHTQSDEGCS